MNNRNLIITLFAFFALVNLQAQVTFRPGINAGLNLAKITNSELGNKTDFYIGGFGALKLSKFYTLQPELTYSRQGGKGTYSVVKDIYDPNTGSYTRTTQSGTVNGSLQYISALTISKFNLIQNFYVLAGPFADILIASDFKADATLYQSNYTKGEDIDLGIIGGLGYSLKNGFAFEARVKKGLTNAFINEQNYSSTKNNTNLVFQFGAAYTFGKK